MIPCNCTPLVFTGGMDTINDGRTGLKLMVPHESCVKGGVVVAIALEPTAYF